jgi:hypothetical protein
MTHFTFNTESSLNQIESFPKKFMILVGFVIFADWLFYAQPIGISLALFIVALAAAVIFCNSHQNTFRAYVIHIVILLFALLPLIEDLGFLSVVFGVMGVAYFTQVVTTDFTPQLSQRLLALTWLLVSGPVRCFEDIAHAARAFSNQKRETSYANKLIIWIVPVVLVAIFTMLFALANPLIGDWLSYIDLWAFIRLVNFNRLIFWLLMLVAIWPFIFICIPLKPRENTSDDIDQSKDVPREYNFFGRASILRAVLLCNALFAIQTATDIIYLWIGVTLPDGVTYASYAHRGAYLLIVTALLAGGFVIAAMRPGSAAERSPTVRFLVYIWIAQNVLLVLSSALRLEAYVEVYSLTWWRTAAFVWMFLVAAGLIAIIARMALNRPNMWLVSTMLYASMATLYVCGLIDIPYLMAQYNVAHCCELTGKGTSLDVAYVIGLGPSAIPALDVYRRRIPLSDPQKYDRQQLVDELSRDKDNWRSWTFRLSRLRSYVDHQSGAPGDS